MSQHDYDITTEDANTGILFRAAVNAAIQALASNNAGPSAPANPYCGMWWPNTETDILYIRNLGNTAWIVVGTVSAGLFPVVDKYAADAGEADNYAITLEPALTSHVVGLPISFKATYANTGASIITVGSLAEKTIKKNGTEDLEENDIVAGQIVTISYDGVYYQMITPSGNKLCWAWVNFDGATGDINASHNVSSITVNSQGYYTVNFINSLPDANYAVNVTGQRESDGAFIIIGGVKDTSVTAYNAGSIKVITSNYNGNMISAAIVNVSVFR